MKFLLVIFNCLLAMVMRSQDLPCGVDSDQSHGTESARRERLETLRATARMQIGEITYVPLKIHLFGLDGGFGYLSTADVNDAVAYLNQEYYDAGFQFYFSGTEFANYANSQ